MAALKGEAFLLNLREPSGAPGDLGTLPPLMPGAIAAVCVPLRRDARP